MSDVVIAGGGIAGSALAILLGRRGLSVELFERSTFPREKPCGEGLMPGGVAVLERLGLADALGGVRFHGVRYHFGGQQAAGRFPPTPGFPSTGLGQRRRNLDDLLFRTASTTPGVATHAGAWVAGPLVEAGGEGPKVAGLVVDGMEHRAALTVAADGARSRIRSALNLDLPVRRKRLGVRAHFRLSENVEQTPWVDVFVFPGHEIYVAPLPEKEMLVAALADAGGLHEPIENAFRRWIDAAPLLANRLEGAEQISPLLSTSPLAARARSGVAPGIVLLGDAAGFVDPITGGGMTQALMTAELLADYIERNGLSAEGWLACFERERSALLRDYRLLTQTVLWLADRPKFSETVLSLLRASPRLFSHLIGVSAGMRPLFSAARSTPVRERMAQTAEQRLER